VKPVRATNGPAAIRRLAGPLVLSPVLLASCGGEIAASRPAPAVVTIGPAPAQVAEDTRDRSPDSGAAGATDAPRGMVYVPPGPFLRGCSPADTSCYAIESPPARIHLDGFYIDRREVTVAAYRACVAAGACSEEGLTLHTPDRTTYNGPSTGANTTRFLDPAESDTCNWTWKGGERDRHPINCETWDQARAYCAWAGKRLPTEAEWEKAARGTDERIYPWGDDPPSCALTVMDEGALGCGAGHTAEVGSRPRGQNASGILDLSGNVAEWVADWYAPDYYARSPAANPPGPPSGRFRVIRGGSFRVRPANGVDGLRISNRYSYVPSARLDYLGFRCARGAAVKMGAPGAG
jgi:formylglycine-generating enzyme required for sulfatase activity